MNEFDHRIPLDRVRNGDRLDLAATEGERAAIADRLGINRLDRFEAHVALARDGQRVRATGRIKASLEQPCVATGDPVPALVDESFDILFLPEPKAARADEEVELAADDLDTMFHDGSAIELGSAIVDSLALALDPYPRSAGADAALKEAGVLSEEEAGPFGALAALRDKLGGNGP